MTIMNITPNTLSQLLVNEAINELEKHFEKTNDKNLHIETHAYELGIKPGFSIAALLCMEGNDVTTPNDAGRFITTNLFPKLFGSRGKFEYSNNTLVLSFKAPLPNPLKCIVGNDNKFTPEQTHWFKSNACFMAGVVSGALSHFGYKVQASIDPINVTELVMRFAIEDLEGAWTFSTKIHH